MIKKGILKSFIIFTAASSIAGLVTAQENCYFFKNGEVVREFLISDIDSVVLKPQTGVVKEGFLQVHLHDKSVEKISVFDVDSISFSPVWGMNEKLVLQEDGPSASIGFTSMPVGKINIDSVAWEISNDSVAILKEGEVIPQKPGSCLITGVYGGKRISCSIYVHEKNATISNGHVYVDLGLSSGTKWALTNIGANMPEEYGNYYSWSETLPTEDFSRWLNYYGGCIAGMRTNGIIDAEQNSTNKYDAAYVNWGTDWRTPTKDQFDELINECSYKLTSMNGVNGMEFVGPNGKSIFLPSAEYHARYSKTPGNSSGYYLSRTLISNSAPARLHFEKPRYNDKLVETDGENSDYWFPIRPVYVGYDTLIRMKKNADILVTLDKYSLNFVSDIDGITADDVEWISSDENIAKVDNGVVYPQNLGTCVVTGKYKSQVLECQVNVYDQCRGYVDLGLTSGTKWATADIGAANPLSDGLRFDWCGTQLKECFCGDCHIGFKIKLDTAFKYDSEYDAAMVHFGREWRIPTKEECRELLRECNVKKVEKKDSVYYVVTGPSGDSILFTTSQHWTSIKGDPKDRFGSGNAYSFILENTFFSSSPGSGFYKRPVYVGLDSVVSITAPDSISLYLGSGNVYSFKLTSSPNNNLIPSDINWESTDNSVATIVDGVVYPQKAGECVVIGEYLGQKFEFHVLVFEQPELVDLGLPSGLKWATQNVCANSASEVGQYFAWGETELDSKVVTRPEIYTSKITTLKGIEIIDIDQNLTADYDIATLKVGKQYKIPSKKDFNELKEHCTIEEKKVDGKRVLEVTGPNGNSIILPIAGFKNYKSSEKKYNPVPYDTTRYYYQTSTVTEESTVETKPYCFTNSTSYSNNLKVLIVRPVSRDYDSINISVKEKLNIALGTPSQSLCFVSNGDEKVSASDCEWKSSDENVAIVNEKGFVSAVKTGECIVSATYKGRSANCAIRVIPAPQYVDLGLPSGLKWATCNVGASVPEESGDFFAWGETSPKNVYVSDNSLVYKKNFLDLQGMGITYHYEYVSTLSNNYERATISPKHDAATQNLGMYWRMPTGDDFSELMKYCQKSVRVVNGMQCCVLTGPNGNSIIVPMAGSIGGTTLKGVDSRCYIRTSFVIYDTSYMDYLEKQLNDLTNISYGKGVIEGTEYGISYSDGMPVRAVYEGDAFDSDTTFFMKESLEVVLTHKPVSIGFEKRPSNIPDSHFKWTTSDKKVARIYEGYVYPIGVGTCEIIAEYGNIKAVCKVTVKNADTYVDLGLPSGVLWATCNLGAESYQDHGNKYEWGTIEPDVKTTYNDSVYSSLLELGVVDTNHVLTEMYDAASIYNSDYRMPTSQDFNELMTYCKGEFGEYCGSKCYIFTGPNGSKLYFPYMEGIIATSFAHTECYWSSSISSKNPTYWGIEKSGKLEIGTTNKYNSYYIRPVLKKLMDKATISVPDSITMSEDSDPSNIFTCVPLNLATPSDVAWSSSDESVAKVADGIVTPVSTGKCVITAKYNDQTFECKVTVNKSHEYVDLGLPSGTLWATCNVGASTPEEFGDYYSLGEPYTKAAYSVVRKDPVLVNKVLADECDAAYVMWGNGWCTPTKAIYDELIKQCKKETTEINGVKGCLFTGPNGNTMFLPFSGYRSQYNLVSGGELGYYWTSSVESIYSYYFLYMSETTSLNVSTRQSPHPDEGFGLPIRPIKKK
ncbi:MAG: hypothetical protein KBT22_05730 [Bacteroidales bacterium]|nr:hypothetical protein [Candidatus Scybalocola fimicaballi]